MRRLLAVAAVACGALGADAAARYDVPDGTALYFPFDNLETALASFGPVKATLRAGEGSARFSPEGRTGGCLYFDGSSTVTLPGVPEGVPAGDAPYTVAAWIRADADCPRAGGWVSYGDKSPASGNSFRLDGPDAVHNYWNSKDLTGATPGAADGRWHHVAGTWDGARRKLYFDGRPVAENQGSPHIGRSLFMIGATMHDRPFKGSVDEVLVAARAFGADEVAALAAGGVKRAGVRAPSADDAGAQLVDGAFIRPDYRPLAVTAAAARAGGWTVTFTFNADGLAAPCTLFEIPGALQARFRFAGTDPSMDELDNRFGNYLNFRTADGKCPVLEARIPGQSTIGVPLGCLKRPGGDHRVTVRRGADAQWFITVDEAYDDESLRQPEVAWPDEPRVAVHSARVKNLKAVSPAIPRPARPDSKPIARPIQFWTPDGFNTWVGDVVVGVYKGRFHVFYLIDRRHHGGKGGAGGHHFEHISSADLVRWDEHPSAVGLDEWWHTLGTGTPFTWNGKFCLAYGLHTTRFMGSEKTTEPFLKKYFEEHGDTGVFDFDELEGYPLGGTYAESEDGIHFTRTRKLIHPAQNPTVYNRADGRLGLVNSYGGIHGIYVSDDKPWGWKLEDGGIPISGDCPCEFEWNGRHYLIQGFQHMAYNPDGSVGNWTDWSQTGDDVYDGMSVPMVAPWPGNRRIMVGWIGHPRGWGGWLAFHELVQYPDGRLGVKWLAETPPPGDTYAYDVPAGRPFAVRFPAGKGAGAALELRVDAVDGRAQYANVRADGKAPYAYSNAEINRSGRNEAIRRRNGPAHLAEEYAVERIRGLDKPYKVRVAAYYDAKADVTLFDAEIAGRRAMICRRPGRFAAPVRAE